MIRNPLDSGLLKSAVKKNGHAYPKRNLEESKLSELGDDELFLEVQTRHLGYDVNVARVFLASSARRTSGCSWRSEARLPGNEAPRGEMLAYARAGQVTGTWGLLGGSLAGHRKLGGLRAGYWMHERLRGSWSAPWLRLSDT